jgi:WhiB family redox-sensing transcriptional regulator
VVAANTITGRDAGSGLSCVLDDGDVPLHTWLDHELARARACDPEPRPWKAGPDAPDRECLAVDCAELTAPHRSPNLCEADDARARAWVAEQQREARAYEGWLLRTTIGPRARASTKDAIRSVERALVNSSRTDDLALFAVPAWHRKAACRAEDPKLFFPDAETKRATAQAKAICAGCAVRDECLRDALVKRPLPFPDHRALEVLGVWAGTTTAERDDLRKSTAAVAA